MNKIYNDNITIFDKTNVSNDNYTHKQNHYDYTFEFHTKVHFTVTQKKKKSQYTIILPIHTTKLLKYTNKKHTTLN